MKKYMLSTFALAILLFSLLMVSAVHTVTKVGGGSYAVNYNTDQVFNISIANTDTSFAANVTQVNITIPSSFVFTAGTQGTNELGTFSNTSVNLIWLNNTWLIENSTTGYFWFTAKGTVIGSYNIIVGVTNETGTDNTNVAVTINDVTNPVVSLTTPTDSSRTDQSLITYVGSFTDDYQLSAAKLYVWYSNGSVLGNNVSAISGTSNSSSLTYSLSTAGTYIWNYEINDTTNNAVFATTNKSFIYDPNLNNPPGGAGPGGSNIPTVNEQTQTNDVAPPAVVEKTSFMEKVVNGFRNFFGGISKFFKNLF